MCLISLTQRNETRIRFTNLRARLMAKDTVPTHTGGIFPLFKDNEMTMYSMYHQMETGFLGGGVRMEGETFYSTCLMPLIRREKQLSFFVAGLVKAQLTTLSLSESLKGQSLLLSSSGDFSSSPRRLAERERTPLWRDTVPLPVWYVKSSSLCEVSGSKRKSCGVKSICRRLGREDATFCLTWHSTARCQKCHVNRLI